MMGEELDSSRKGDVAPEDYLNVTILSTLVRVHVSRTQLEPQALTYPSTNLSVMCYDI
jgi:hypothetical protein